ncbi:MAG: hypothetical protein ACREKH_13095 [Candidatus Rokuibacteriota bacterium]
MKRMVFLVIVTMGVLALLGASASCNRRPVQTVMVPPLIDLRQHEMIGVVEFGSTSKGQLAPFATRRFIESARRDQGLVRIVELGSKAAAIRSVGGDGWDAETVKALGAKHGVQTILTGELTISSVRPDVRVSASLRSGEVSAMVDATLAVQMFESGTGASIWSSSGRATQGVGHISVFGGKGFAFDAKNPEEAYGGLVDGLVEQVTGDFHVSWQQR